MSAPTRPNRLRTLLAGGAPLVAVSYSDDDPSGAAAEALAWGVDVAELRIDRYSDRTVEHVGAVVATFAPLCTLATIRSAAEGGDWPGSSLDRLALLAAVIPHVDGVDIELSSSDISGEVVALGRPHGTVVIASHHDFATTPGRAVLDQLVARADDLGADLLKVAAFVNGPGDLRRLAAFTLDHADRGVIVIGMGPVGAASRVFFPLLGSRLTYTHTGRDRWDVPGQLRFDETVELLRRFSPEHPSGQVLGLPEPR